MQIGDGRHGDRVTCAQGQAHFRDATCWGRVKRKYVTSECQSRNAQVRVVVAADDPCAVR